jgi:hypothetical protein
MDIFYMYQLLLDSRNITHLGNKAYFLCEFSWLGSL